MWCSFWSTKIRVKGQEMIPETYEWTGGRVGSCRRRIGRKWKLWRTEPSATHAVEKLVEADCGHLSSRIFNFWRITIALKR